MFSSCLKSLDHVSMFLSCLKTLVCRVYVPFMSLVVVNSCSVPLHSFIYYCYLAYCSVMSKHRPTSQKHRKFVEESMFNKKVTDLAGIGPVSGRRLAEAGYTHVSERVTLRAPLSGTSDVVNQCLEFVIGCQRHKPVLNRAGILYVAQSSTADHRWTRDRRVTGFDPRLYF